MNGDCFAAILVKAFVACTAWTINTSAAPSSPVAIAFPVPSHIVDIFTLFSSSENFSWN
jgi:hypothetical protein